MIQPVKTGTLRPPKECSYTFGVFSLKALSSKSTTLLLISHVRHNLSWVPIYTRSFPYIEFRSMAQVAAPYSSPAYGYSSSGWRYLWRLIYCLLPRRCGLLTLLQSRLDGPYLLLRTARGVRGSWKIPFVFWGSAIKEIIMHGEQRLYTFTFQHPRLALNRLDDDDTFTIGTLQLDS